MSVPPAQSLRVELPQNQYTEGALQGCAAPGSGSCPRDLDRQLAWGASLKAPSPHGGGPRALVGRRHLRYPRKEITAANKTFTQNEPESRTSYTCEEIQR